GVQGEAQARLPRSIAGPRGGAMLEMRPGCECCDRDLPPESGGAHICSFECTFCESCATGVLGGICPNCGGALVPRPPRTLAKLASNPASARRVYKPGGCVKPA